MGLNTEEPLTLTELIKTSEFKEVREFYIEGDEAGRVSKWVELQKDQKYYIEGWHFEWYSDDHYVVGVEIEQ